MFIEFSLHEWAVSSTLSSFRAHKNAGLLWCLHQRLRIMTNQCLTSTMIPQGTLKLQPGCIPLYIPRALAKLIYWLFLENIPWVCCLYSSSGIFLCPTVCRKFTLSSRPGEYCHFSWSPSFLILLCRNKTEQNSLLLASNFYDPQFVHYRSGTC